MGALTLAPISLVQSVIAGGLVLLTVVANRLFGIEVTRRERVGVALMAAGLAFLAATLDGDARSAHSHYDPSTLAAYVGCLGIAGLALAAGSRRAYVLRLIGNKTGPVLRSTGVPWDLRRTMPYLDYDKLDFDVIVGTYGDNFDRYSVRLNEIRESIKMIRQIAERMPAGDYRVQDRKVTPPPRARIDESMEALIHHFKIFTEGFRVPEGEVYVAIESPRGELGCYMVSDGTSKPYRMHIRGPSFVNLQALPVLLRGGLMADAVAVISSVDPVMGEVDR